jgi:hypothetical protein
MQTKENIKKDGDNRLKTARNGVVTKAQVTEGELVLYINSQIHAFAEILDPTLQKGNAEAQDDWVAMTKGATKDAVQEGTEIINEWLVTHYTPEALRDRFKTSSPTVFGIMDEALDRHNKMPDALNNSLNESNLPVELVKWLVLRDALRDEVERRKQAKEKKRESSKFPEVVPAQTSEEIKYGLRAITDGKTLQNWTRSPFETACIHAIPGAPFEIKLFTNEDTETHETLEAIIKEFSSPVAALFCQFIFNSVLIHERAHLELDSLIRELGFEVRTAADRQKHRARVFDWIQALSRLGCFGERHKPYRDSFTNKKEKIYSKGRYIYLGDPYFTDEQLSNKEKVPTAQTIIAGDWAEQYRGNRKILQDIGNIRRLVGLPVEQGRGEWALSIALTLLQYWREESASAVIGTVGNDKKPTPRFKKLITRRKLLYTFQPTKFAVDKILKRQNAKRDALDFWNGAFGLLDEREFFAHKGKSKFEKESDLPLRNWQNAWLDEELDIRPRSEARENVFEMIKNVETAKKRRRKSVS